MSEAACWCGATALGPFDGDYRRCAACGCLVSEQTADVDRYRAVSDDEQGHYGCRYWFHHVPHEQGLPSLEQRAESDLSERAVAWLRWLLTVAAPPASVLELGSAHGGFVYLLGRAGFDAEGLEMSPAVIEFARRRFGVTVHRGPLERARLTRRYDVIAAMDVLEHLPSPLETLRACHRRLADDGVLLLQTPRVDDPEPGWEMLIPADHLYLFTADAARRLLREAGFRSIEVEPGCFPYDMWLTAAKTARRPRRADPRAGATPIAAALLDACGQRSAAQGERDRALAERQTLAARLADLAEERDAIDADRRTKDRDIARLAAEREAIDADRRDKDAVIASLAAERDAIDADRRAKDETIARVAAEREAIDADRRAKDEVIARLAAERDAIDADRRAKDEVIARLEDSETQSRADALERRLSALRAHWSVRLTRFLRQEI